LIARELAVPNRLGLHARAAARFVQTASRLRSQVVLESEGRRRDGKSILGVLLLAAGRGSRLTLEVDGPDEEKAMEALERLVAAGFGEGTS